MPTKIYDIHQHLFNHDIINKKIVALATALAQFIHIQDDDDSAIGKIAGSLDEFLEIIGSDTTQDVYALCHAAYEEHFDMDEVEMIYTPLTFDLTYADFDFLKSDNDGDEITERRKQALNQVRLLGTLARVVGGFVKDSAKIQVRKLGKKIQELAQAIEVSENVINNQNYESQVADMETLVNIHGSHRIKPFYSVDPRNVRRPQPERSTTPPIDKPPVDYISVLTDKILNGSWHGVKLYSTVGFSPLDPVLYDDGGVFEFCVQHDIPITAHNSDAGFGAFASQIRVFGGYYDMKSHKVVMLQPGESKVIRMKHELISVQAGDALHERAETFNHPKLWEKVLEKYPTLRLNLAHFGGSGPLMDLVYRELPSHMEDMSQAEYDKFLGQFDLEEREFFEDQVFYATKRKNNKRFKLRDTYMIHEKDSPEEIAKKKEAKAALWEHLYDLGALNNWARHHLDLLQNEDFKNLYVDLSAFSEGRIYSYDIPSKYKEMRRTLFHGILNKLDSVEDRAWFKGAYKSNITSNASKKRWKLKEGLTKDDELRLNLMLWKACQLPSDILEEIDIVNEVMGANGDLAILQSYLKDNEKFSIMEEVYHFKKNLYDKLPQWQKEKILYGSDFYFTQVFGPRHEQYVQDFKNVFGEEFLDIANKHCEKFLALEVDQPALNA